MKKWENPELRDLSLKATKEEVECPNKPKEADSSNYCIEPTITLPKDICCNCDYYGKCTWWWKYKGGCDVIS